MPDAVGCQNVDTGAALNILVKLRYVWLKSSVDKLHYNPRRKCSSSRLGQINWIH